MLILAALITFALIVYLLLMLLIAHWQIARLEAQLDEAIDIAKDAIALNDNLLAQQRFQKPPMWRDHRGFAASDPVLDRRMP